MNGTIVMTLGSHVSHSGAVWTVVEFIGTEVLLEADTSKAMARVRVASLLDPAGDFHLLREEGPSDETNESATFDLIAGTLSPNAREEVTRRAADVREVLTGYKSGSADVALSGEPKAEYAPDTGLMARYRAKASELRVSPVTVRSWVARYRRDRELGLVDRRSQRPTSRFHATDLRWVKIAQEVIDERTNESDRDRGGLLRTIRARIEATYGDSVKLPGRTSAYNALNELMAGKSTSHNAIRRRSIAATPQHSFGRFEASRPGQVILMDTTRTDVLAINPITGKWINTELTVAMDLYSRCIVGLQLTPISTKSVDVSSVLYEVLVPRPAPAEWPDEAVWPYHGVPENVLIDADRNEVNERRLSGPGLSIDNIVVDHGKIFVSSHLTGACERLGISLQPARKGTPSDKSPVERFFHTIRTGLFQHLPGYKGQDVQARGKWVEKNAFYLINELDATIREWIAVSYHRSPGSGVADNQLPGVNLSPRDRYAHGVARAGVIVMPSDPSLALRMLPVILRKIEPEGVSYLGLIYRGEILTKYRKRHGPAAGGGGKFQFSVDAEDLRQIYFQDPEDHQWHVLAWEAASNAKQPFNSDALKVAKEHAAAKGYDTEQALIALLARREAGLEMNSRERKAALRAKQKREEVERAVESLQASSTASGGQQEPSQSVTERPADPAREKRNDTDTGDYYDGAVELY
ncbi:hypothetical protein [Arthrobacter sp. NPDC089319]|uniref:hypothetical protein n=1 Tax=Arthrobacter sp. NPDC089319 TaxID=3155915 RepID=UPI003438D21E